MAREYVEQRKGGYLVEGKALSLDSIVSSFLRGAAVRNRRIRSCFAIAQIFGALAFYRANPETVDCHWRKGRPEFETLREQVRLNNPARHRKLAAGAPHPHSLIARIRDPGGS
ncbi:MAG: hypothetical protein EXQ52_11725 [Bryobacterales bacterium]|nr:hypothetical protein [Bryobacterales bacterium]